MKHPTLPKARTSVMSIEADMQTIPPQMITTKLGLSQPIVTGAKYNAMLNGLAEDKFLGKKEKSAPERGILTALKPTGRPTYRW